MEILTIKYDEKSESKKYGNDEKNWSKKYGNFLIKYWGYKDAF